MIYSAVIEKRNKYCKTININHLLILCDLKEDYKLFCDDLEELIKSKRGKNLVKKVFRVIQGKSFFILNKYKSFYEKHKHTIEIMNTYSCLYDFMVFCYDEKGERKENLSLDYFYQYICEHQVDVETIKAVVLKIKTLGFEEITFGENLDFTNIEYELDPSCEDSFAFLENMEINPSYLNHSIKYHTKGSCYCLILNGNDYDNNKYDQKIKLNSLVFDPDKLPNEITKESTIGIIKKLVEKKKVEPESISCSEDIRIATKDLKKVLEHLKQLYERIKYIRNTQELMNLINQIQNILDQLQLLEINFESPIIESFPSVSDESRKRKRITE